MQRISQFGGMLLAILLIAAVAQCAVVCQTNPIQAAKAEANVPPCHKHSKAPASTNDCSHPQSALLAATANLVIDWAIVPATFDAASSLETRSSLLVESEAVSVRLHPSPPLCLRV